MSNKPSILIVGAGAIGSFYGAILKKAGCSVSTVLRSEYDESQWHPYFQPPG